MLGTRSLRSSEIRSTWLTGARTIPSLLARKNKAALKATAIYFNCGQADDYGFEKGAAALDKQLTSEGIVHEYRPYPGGHSMNYFLSHLGEVIEFHSRRLPLLAKRTHFVRSI